MADIEIRIRGARGAGKTTLAKYLHNLFVNSTYFVESVEDSDVLSTRYILDPAKRLEPIVRAPRSVSIEIIETTFEADTDVLEDDDD